MNCLLTIATRTPRPSDTTCVNAETCGSTNMRSVTAKNVMVLGCLHHLEENEGVLNPIVAKMMFENPIDTTGEQKKAMVAIPYAVTSSLSVHL